MDVISDVRDEHDSTIAFFDNVQKRINKWMEIWRQDKEK